MIREVIASEFATIQDLNAYHMAKARGLSDRQAFAIGDNGIGCWGDLTAQAHTAMAAIPPEHMAEEWGSVSAAKHQRILVLRGNISVECIIADRMPHLANITNGAGIDLNPAASNALDLPKGGMVKVTWGKIENGVALESHKV